MRIALVPGAFHPLVGGVELAAYNLAKQWQLRGHEVHVITSRPLPLVGNLAPFEVLDGIPVHRLRFYAFRGSWKSLAALLIFMPLACIQYACLIRRQRFDVVNVQFFYHNALATWIMLPLLRHWGVRVVVTLQGGDAPNISDEYRSTHRAESALLTWVAKRLLPRADCVTAVSTILSAKTQQQVPDLTDCVVIHNGVDLEQFAPRGANSASVLVSIGRLVFQKGIDVLLRAFADVHRAHPTWRLVVIGDGPLRGEMEALATRLQLASSVRFCGSLLPIDVAEELRRGSIFVLASRFEGFGTVVIEAMACGKPVVMTETEASHELVTHRDRGRIVAIDDVEALSGAVTELIDLGFDRLSEMGASCRTWVEERFSWQQIARSYEMVFADRLGNHPRRRSFSSALSGAPRS